MEPIFIWNKSKTFEQNKRALKNFSTEHGTTKSVDVDRVALSIADIVARTDALPIKFGTF